MIENSAISPREKAIQSGELIDISHLTKEAGISCPTALTSGVLSIGKQEFGFNDMQESEFLWNIAYYLYSTIADSAKVSFKAEVTFEVPIPARKDRANKERLMLKATIHYGSGSDLAITIMLPTED